MLAEQKYHSKVLDGICVSDRKEMKREKMEEEGGGIAGSREGGGSGARRVVWAHGIQIKDPEGRDLAAMAQQDSGCAGTWNPGLTAHTASASCPRLVYNSND